MRPIIDVDGIERDLPGEGTASLWEVLDCHGVRIPMGCGTGHCGACTVLLDGTPTPSCLVPQGSVRGAHIQTAGGAAALPALVEAMAGEGAVQCGFCSPGVVITLSWAIRAAVAQRRCLEADEIRELLIGHLCRCTGYQAIIAAAGAACRAELDAADKCGA
ncbi:(2Fe-2S)-binding protein [Mycobacterium sp. smrl_JER01]|uniref:(2Fe-2S)-binding protein n=1 Tax=Mycobacterium sp. smrl_JER01 TaxID=3402633 RepID=UPI003AC1661F